MYGGKPGVMQLQAPPAGRNKGKKPGATPSMSQQQLPAQPSGAPAPNPGAATQKLRAEQHASTNLPPPATFPCPHEDCDLHTVGLATEAARDKHIHEEHVKPFADPEQYVLDGFDELINADAMASPPAGSSTMDKTPSAGGTATKQDQGAGGGNTTGTGKTVDPRAMTSDIFWWQREQGGGDALPLYRSTTPADDTTPESRGESNSSDDPPTAPNSDVSECLALDINVDTALQLLDDDIGEMYKESTSQLVDIDREIGMSIHNIHRPHVFATTDGPRSPFTAAMESMYDPDPNDWVMTRNGDPLDVLFTMGDSSARKPDADVASNALMAE